MQRNVLNILLGVAALGLGAAVIYSQKREVKGPPLTPFAVQAIHHIRIEHPGSPTIELSKQGSEWSLIAPVKAEADPFEVNGVLAVASLEAQTTLDPKRVVLKDLKLDPPQYSVSFNDQKLDIGDVEPIQYRRYLLTMGKVVLVSDPPSAALDADYSDLVAKTLLPSGAEILSITLPDLSIAKSADGKHWQLSKGDENATSDAKQKLVDAWQHARALWNASAAKDAKGDKVTVTTKTGTLEFIITQRSPQLVLTRPDLGVSYTLSEELMKSLLQLPGEKKDAKK
jgi:hypothetical protein